MKLLIKYFIKKELRNFSNILHSIFFFAVSIFLFSFFISKQAGGTDSIYAGLIFIIIILTLNLRSSSLFMAEYRSGILEQFILNNFSYLDIILARFISFYIVELIPLLLFFPISGILFSLEFNDIILLFLVFMISLPIIINIFILNAILLLKAQNKLMLLSSISFPLLFGPLIFTALTIISLFKQNDFFSYIENLIYLELILTPIVILFASKALAIIYSDKFK